MTSPNAACDPPQDPLPEVPAVFTIGVIADTHIPDRVRSLHPGILPALTAAGAKHILHAGDISTGAALEDLARVAPVTAVRGNRDLFLRHLQMVVQIELGGARITLLHGHGGWMPYLWDKFKFLRHGYRLERYLKLLNQAGPHSHVIVFGHTHYPEIRRQDGRLFFNPGSASFGYLPGDPPSFGLLHIASDGQVRAEIIPLEGWRIERRHWIAI